MARPDNKISSQTNFRFCKGLSDACLRQAGAADCLGRQASDKPQGRKPRGLRLGGSGWLVYGDLTVAGWLWRVAGSVGSRDSGRRRGGRGGIPTPWRWRGREVFADPRARGVLEPSGAVAGGRGRQYSRFSKWRRSWAVALGWWRGAECGAGLEGLDDDHGSAATGAGGGERICPVIGCCDGFGFVFGRRHLEQLSGPGEVPGAPAVGEEAPGSSPGQAPWRMRWKPWGRTWRRKRRMNSSRSTSIVAATTSRRAPSNP